MNFASDVIDKVLISEQDIQTRIRELGSQISHDYRMTGVHLVGVLKGSVPLVADLLRAIHVPVTVDFLAVSGYGPAERRRGSVRVIKDLDQNVAGRPVLVVEDVIDTGLTLSYILRILRARQPASLNVLAFLDRPGLRLVDLPIRYVGFPIPDDFLIGYGLDYQERYRNLPFIATLKPSLLD
ncbi:MAG TPA: hypoxanthine phosphoribosyltransferase [Chloroflexota bacterium]|nr:hypoxanthine phosphoribosyltransferase [Chloroflexota bacterium]